MGWATETPLRKNITQTIFILLALVLLAKAVLLFRQAVHVGVAESMYQNVYVNGHAEEYIKPDTMMFTLSVNEEGKDIAEATTKSAEKLNKAIASLKANGVEEKNIKTTYYNVSDKYEQVNTPCAVALPSGKYMTMQAVQPCSNISSKIVGSIVSQTLEVKVRDIEKNATAEKRAKIVADLAASAVKIDSFSFTIFDLDEAKSDVRKTAIKNAKEEAKKLEQQLGVNLGHIVGFTENTGGYNPYMSARAESQAMGKVTDVAAPATPLPEGEQKVTVDVTLSYLIK